MRPQSQSVSETSPSKGYGGIRRRRRLLSKLPLSSKGQRCYCARKSPLSLFQWSSCCARKKVSGNPLAHLPMKIDCTCGHNYHPASALIQIIQAKFNRLREELRSGDFACGVKLRLSDFGFLRRLFYARTSKLWCEQCDKDVEITSDADVVSLLNEQVDKHTMTEADVSLCEEKCSRFKKIIRTALLM